jgi:hypothetical protein
MVSLSGHNQVVLAGETGSIADFHLILADFMQSTLPPAVAGDRYSLDPFDGIERV